MSTKTERIETKDKEGKDMVIFVKKPTYHQLEEAQLEANKAFRKAIDSKSMTREAIDAYMREQGLWNDEKQAELERLSKIITDGERQLVRGGRTKDGKKFTKVEARELALQIRRTRFQQTMMLAKQRELDQYTVQGQAENTKFNYLVSVCTFDEEGAPIFKSLDDYLEKGEEPYAIAAASQLGNLYYGLDPDYEKNRIENKFLVQYGFARDTDLHLVDKDGNPVDVDGKRVNDDGRYLNEKGELVDRSGNRVDDKGNPVEDFVPFEDDEPAVQAEDEDEEAEVATSK